MTSTEPRAVEIERGQPEREQLRWKNRTVRSLGTLA